MRGGRSYSLQWGRDLSVAEGHYCASMTYQGPPLQWGRDLSVAEGAMVSFSNEMIA